jgi:2-hydroxy-6-oxonona-2,4-dienedioate hydrolase
MVDAGGIETGVIEAGNPNLPALFPMHGTGGHAEAYLRNIGELARYFHLIVFDFVGHGWSDAPDMPYTLDVYASHLEELLSALGVDAATCPASRSAAGWHPGTRRTRHSASIASSSRCRGTSPQSRRRWKNCGKAPVRRSSMPCARTCDHGWSSCSLRKTATWSATTWSRSGTSSIPGRQRRGRSSTCWPSRSPRSAGIRPGRPSGGRIEVSTLILWTEHDPTGPVSEGHLPNEWIPGSELIVMPEAGHWPQWERPEEFIRIHREFLHS